MINQEIFNIASEAYDEAVNLIERLGGIANKSDTQNSYDIGIMKNQFDILLQSMLLEVACSDAKISGTEAEFIDRITKRVNILDRLKLKFSDGEFVTWKNICRLNPSDYNYTCNGINEATEKPIANLINLLGVVDGLTETDYFEQFNEYISVIVLGLCHIDGELNESRDVVNQIIRNKWCNRWQFVINKVKEELSK